MTITIPPPNDERLYKRTFPMFHDLGALRVAHELLEAVGPTRVTAGGFLTTLAGMVVDAFIPLGGTLLTVLGGVVTTISVLNVTGGKLNPERLLMDASRQVRHIKDEFDYMSLDWRRVDIL